MLPAACGPQAAAAPLDDLADAVPRTAEQLQTVDVARLQQLVGEVDDWVYENSLISAGRRGRSPLAAVAVALESKSRVDALLDEVLALRKSITSLPAAPPDDAARRNAARGFLRAAAALIDLTGRLRYGQNDVVRNARTQLQDAASREQLVDLGARYRSTVVATQSAEDLLAFARQPRYHEKILRLLAATGQTASLPSVLRFVDDARQPAPMRLFAAEIVPLLGLPQQPRPNPVETNLPDPVIQPDGFYNLVEALPRDQLDDEGAKRRDTLLAWADVRRKKGVTDDFYRVAGFAVEPGDWLLMRNPSPYNRFTDLSPGLFTHVGMVAAETGADGIRRFVIVDVPERGDRVPAVNVEIYLERTLHYCFLRDPDKQAAAAMAKAAAEVIDNPSLFDLNFRNDRVEALAHTPLDGKKIHTYCAGLLLLSALQTEIPREEYFPLAERQGGGHMVDNVAKIGLSLGKGFLSPSGALFSPRMKIVGLREPMYDPKREVEEAVYDEFARLLEERPMQDQGDWFNALRLKTAEAARANPLLAQALASAAGVNAETDLVAAAKAAAVVETLDEIALAASANFQAARDALRGAPLPADATPLEQARRTNAIAENGMIIQAVRQGRLSPRAARLALVQNYIEAGQAALRERFFGE